MDADSFRRAVSRLALIAVILLLLPWLGVGLAALGAANAYFEPALQDRARMVGQSVAQRFERAVDLGAPLRELVAVEDYLASVRADQTDVALLALLDVEGGVIARSGDGAVDAEAPVTIQGRVIGRVQVGMVPDALEALRRDALLRLGVALICAAAVAFEVARFWLDRQIAAPARAAHALAAAAAGRRFDQTAGWRGTDAVAAYAVALSRLMRHVGRRHREARALVADLRDARLSDAASADAAAALSAAEAGWVYSDQPSERPAPTPPGFHRFAVFVVAALLGLAAPFIQSLVVQGPHAAILVVTPFLLFASFIGRLLDPLARRLGPRVTILLGAVIAAVAFAWMGEVGGGMRQILVSAAAGVGVGLTLHACGDMFGFEAAQNAKDAQRGAWTGAMAGVVAGLAFAVLIDAAEDPNAAQNAMSLGFIGAGALLAWLAPAYPLPKRPEIWLNGVEIASLMARPRLLLFATQILAPLGAALWVFIAIAPAASGDGASAVAPPMTMLFAAALCGLVGLALARPVARNGQLAAWGLAGAMLAGGATLFFTPFDGGWGSLAFNGANGFFFAFGGPLQSRLGADLALSERGRLGEKRVTLFFRMTEGVSGALGLTIAYALSSALEVDAAARGFGLALIVAAVAFVVGWLALPARSKAGAPDRASAPAESAAAEGDLVP